MHYYFYRHINSHTNGKYKSNNIFDNYTFFYFIDQNKYIFYLISNFHTDIDTRSYFKASNIRNIIRYEFDIKNSSMYCNII